MEGKSRGHSYLLKVRKQLSHLMASTLISNLGSQVKAKVNT